jgi:hypothetical protein
MLNQPFAISKQWDTRELRAVLNGLAPRQYQFATALTLTRVGQRVKTAEIAEMKRVFDRPTPFTLKSLYLQGATRSRQEARVWFKDFAPKGTPAGKYLLPEVHGGNRQHKRFEGLLQHAGLLPLGRSLVPASGAQLDQYGNVSRGLYSKILSQLRAQFDSSANETTRSRGRSRGRQRGGRYFYGNPGGKGRGIWERFTFGFGSAVKPVFLEVSGTPSYRRRFDFFGVGTRVANEAFGPEFDKAAAETVRTSR